MKKNIIILNLTRMGDIIQSIPLFRKIKLYFPDSFVTLAVSFEFAEITKFLPCVDEVKIIELRGLSELLKAVDFKFTSDVYKAVKEMFNDILEKNYDIAVNLSHDDFSAYFLYVLNSKKSVGISKTREDATVSNDKMISYMFSAVKNRKASILNLVDIYARSIDWLKPDSDIIKNINSLKNYSDKNEAIGIYLDIYGNGNQEKEEALHGFKNNLMEYGIKDGDIIVSFAIGASMSSKRWHMNNFASLAEMLLNRDERIKVVILGSQYDTENADYIEKMVLNGINGGRLINLAGKTSVAGLVYVVGRSGLLITHDTGTMHIGVGLGTKLIVIYTGHVGFMETGPYAENRILIVPDIDCFPCDFNIKCMNPVCKSLIRPEYVFDIAERELFGGDGKNARKEIEEGVPACGNPVNFFSKYKNSGIIPFVSRFDSNNFIDFLPAVKIKLGTKDLRLRILKLTLEYFYGKNLTAAGNDYEIKIFLDCFEEADYNLVADLEEEIRVVGTLTELCGKGMEVANSLARLALTDPFAIEKIKESSSTIKSVDFELKYISSGYDELALLNQVHIINQNSSVSYDPFGIAVDSLKSYSDYKRQLILYKNIWSLFRDEIKRYENNNSNNGEGEVINEIVYR